MGNVSEWIKRLWNKWSLGGIALFVWALLDRIKEALRLLGDIDFAINDLPTYGKHLQGVWDFIFEPPGWFRILLIVGGLWLIWWGQRPKKEKAEELISEEMVSQNVSDEQPEVHAQALGWASQAPIVEFKQEFHKRVEVFDEKSGKFSGHKTVYWVDIIKGPETPECWVTVELKGVQVIEGAKNPTDYPMLSIAYYGFHPSDGTSPKFELSDSCPRKSVYIVSRQEGSNSILIEAGSSSGEGLTVPHRGKTYRLRIGVNWDGKTVPMKEFLVWVTLEGELKMEFERDFL